MKKLLPIRTGQRWSETEDELLQAAYDGGLTASQIATEHKRTVLAICYRLVHLNVLSRAGDGRPTSEAPFALDFFRLRP